MEYVLASKNQHKLRELSEILSQYGISLRLQSELNVDIEVEETGTTFEENALLKARAVMQAANLPAIADDSGLVVDALNGAPGIYSARYGGERCRNDTQRYELLLEELKDVPPPERTARFVCVIAVVYPDGKQILAKGKCEGQISLEPMGTGGFGYDPVFYVPSEGTTFSCMSAERKNEISHRANALRVLKELLTEG